MSENQDPGGHRRPAHLPRADGPLADMTLPDGQHLYAVVKARPYATPPTPPPPTRPAPPSNTPTPPPAPCAGPTSPRAPLEEPQAGETLRGRWGCESGISPMRAAQQTAPQHLASQAVLKKFTVPCRSSGQRLPAFDVHHPEPHHKLQDHLGVRLGQELRGFRTHVGGAVAESYRGPRPGRVPAALEAVRRDAPFSQPGHTETPSRPGRAALRPPVPLPKGPHGGVRTSAGQHGPNLMKKPPQQMAREAGRSRRPAKRSGRPACT
jgi:hypothetical protein